MRYDAPSTLPLELAAVEICEESAAPAPPSEAPPPPATAGAARGGARERESRPAPPPRQSRTERSAAPPPEVASPPPESGAGERPPAAAPVAAGQPEGEISRQWTAAVKSLSRTKGRKYMLGALLRDFKAESIELDGQTLILPFSNKANLERMQEELEDPGSRQRVADAIARAFGEGYDFRLTLAGGQPANGPAVKTAAQHSPLVRAALGMGGRILQEQEVEE